MEPHALGVTFDFGQTLAELDTAMLARRLAERGAIVSPERLEAAVPPAWRAYDDAIRRGLGGHPWKLLMRELLTLAGLEEDAIEHSVDFLWTEQPARNLWRRPIAGMPELLMELRQKGVPVAALSNSEGRLAELIQEMGWSEILPIVADSGRLGVEKPARAIFAWTADRLGLPLGRLVHVGDSYAADVEGALGAGMRAVWFRGSGAAPADDRVRLASTAAEVAAALAGFGLAAQASS